MAAVCGGGDVWQHNKRNTWHRYNLESNWESKGFYSRSEKSTAVRSKNLN